MIKVYDQDMTMLAVLDYADEIGYMLPHNDLWTASFKLPARDPKNAFCQMHNLVSIDDGPRDIGLYRIIGIPNDAMTGQGGYTEYTCEHVAATLLDDVLFGYHEIGGGTIRTADVMRYILERQTVKRWQLGACDFSNRFTYKFENDTLLGALLSLGEVLTEPYTWDFDTSTTPWTVSLRKADADAGCSIIYKRNLCEITRTVDASTLVTRLYLLGYGEGVNQLTIKNINNGLPYLEADTVSVYGIKNSVFVDRRFEIAENLKARGEALLESLKIPYITYTATATDLVQLTGDPWDKFMPGKVVHAMDGEDGIEFEARIVNVAKTNVRGGCGDVEITIANSVRDIADSINTLADRQGINELYSQGATNLYAQQYADNADAAHPARMRVFIPSGCVRINQMLLSYESDAFRAYETGAAAGGGTTVTSHAGGASTVTSQAGGSQTVTSGGGGGQTVTSLGGGDMTVTSAGGGSTTATSTSGGGQTATSADGGSSTVTSASGGNATVTSETRTRDLSLMTGSGYDSLNGRRLSYTDYASATEETPSHRHGVDHYHNVIGSVTIPGANIDIPSHTHSVRIGAHSHSVTIDSHSHDVYIPGHTHDVTIYGHSHDVVLYDHSHAVTIYNHSHDVTIYDHTHDVKINPHTHEMVYGIYEGTTASKITIRVDGVAVPGHTAANVDELDIVQWLEKDEEGRILRGAWHTVELVPDKLTRIEANLFVQTFVQSVGGGNY